MRHRVMLVVLAALATLLLSPSDVFAYRHPNLARFMSPDPVISPPA